MEEIKHFITGSNLSTLIQSQTNQGKFLCRNFVEPLIQFCVDENYTARIGIVYGLRSTGKTVGMLQAAQKLIEYGQKVAYARFNYQETGMRDVNAEIAYLAKNEYSHFFIDEATYLGGFLNASSEWADIYVPMYRIKIIVSGTDSFLFWLAKSSSLFHRYVQFSATWVNYSEYKRVLGKNYADYKTSGGIFTSESIPEFIRTALVENLIRSIEHCFDEANRTNEYTSSLIGIDAAVIYKAIISILKCAVESDIIRHFVKNSENRNIIDLGSAISDYSAKEKREFKERVADALDIYTNFTGVENPKHVIESLINFLVKIDCLAEFRTGMSDNGKSQTTYTFTHNALMNYVTWETVQGILNLEDVNKPEFVDAIHQAAEGVVSETIVNAHIIRGAENGDIIFKYRDFENREIDTVVVNRKLKTACLIEVKSKSNIDRVRLFINEAKHLFNKEIQKNIGIDEDFAVFHILVYSGKTECIRSATNILILVNIEDFLMNHMDFWHYFSMIMS